MSSRRDSVPDTTALTRDLGADPVPKSFQGIRIVAGGAPKYASVAGLPEVRGLGMEMTETRVIVDAPNGSCITGR